jgi:hypothetical protein
MHQDGRYAEVASLQLVDEVSDSIIRARLWYDGLIKTPIQADEQAKEAAALKELALKSGPRTEVPQ